MKTKSHLNADLVFAFIVLQKATTVILLQKWLAQEHPQFRLFLPLHIFVYHENLWQKHVMDYMPRNECRKFQDKNARDAYVAVSFLLVWGGQFPIKCPAGGAEAGKEYYNFKHFYSVALMAMVDAYNRFVQGSCRYPGNLQNVVNRFSE